MEDGTPNTVNLDLNLGPAESPNDDSDPVPSPFPTESMNLEDLLDGYRFNEVVRQRRSRWRSVLRNVPITAEARNLAMEFVGRSETQTGDASGERPDEIAKECDNNNGFLNDEISGEKEDDEKGNSEDGSFFDCNICLDLAKEPVVTCCGHLFCWPCIYRWLHLHSDAKECPICKGEVTTKNVIPIYGRGSNVRRAPEEEGSTLKIPPRPHARRVEGWRQTVQRTTFGIPVEEILHRLRSRLDFSQSQNPVEGSHELPEPSSLLINRMLMLREAYQEQIRQAQIRSAALPPEADVVDLTETSPTDSDVWDSRRLSSLLRRRLSSHRMANYTSIASAFGTAGRSAVDPVQVDDRDSVSSIAAVIHSESQTVDTAAEIESRVSLSTSSSRRRNDTSRISDVDTGDSRAPRRRRLN